MKKIGFLILFGLLTSITAKAQRVNPVIKDYGSVLTLPIQVENPDPKIDYKIAIELGDKMQSDSTVDNELEVVARLYNLLVYGGVPRDHIHIAVVIYHAATWVTLDDIAYQKKFGKSNPNIKAIQEMADAGIDFYLCGQSVMGAKLDPNHINPNVKLVLSRLTKMSSLEMQGYINFKL
ncbi:MAG: DsrE family protein [Sphingobacteriales bacterium]|nr:DsrE family protein [Sphingobacteriales bacterium]